MLSLFVHKVNNAIYNKCANLVNINYLIKSKVLLTLLIWSVIDKKYFKLALMLFYLVVLLEVYIMVK